VKQLKEERNLAIADNECDVILIGHGSSDKNAHDAFIFTANALRTHYRQVHHCFLELDRPSIDEGVSNAILGKPKIILMMPYFLHKGAHIKRDVVQEIESTLSKHDFKDAYLSRHLGVDDKLVDLILERTSEVETRAGFRSQ
jgi:precorrin-8X/cobalt-precorrin-8 methylmutase